MLEFIFSPACRTVAALTFFAVASVMGVIRLMAGDAGLFRFLFVDVCIAGMAGIALHFFMLAFKRVFGFFIMIEACFCPVCFVVACRAFFTIACVVCII